MIGKQENIIMQVDIYNFAIKLSIGGQIGKLSNLKSRKVYNYFIKTFQEEYNLQV